jgi:hypothetical protein
MESVRDMLETICPSGIMDLRIGVLRGFGLMVHDTPVEVTLTVLPGFPADRLLVFVDSVNVTHLIKCSSNGMELDITRMVKAERYTPVEFLSSVPGHLTWRVKSVTRSDLPCDAHSSDLWSGSFWQRY